MPDGQKAEQNISRADAELVAATWDAFERRGLSKAFCFHSTNAAAKRFQRDAAALGPLLSADDGGTAPALPSVYRVDGKMRATERQAVLAAARESGERSVVSNCRLLATGVDAPAVDLVVMASPKQSHTDILQMAGRATRRAEGKTAGFVLVLLPIGQLCN